MQAAMKHRILGNPFLDQIRDGKIDRPAFEALVATIESLKEDWRGDNSLDRDVVEYLHLLPTVTSGTAVALQEAGFAAEAEDVRGMASKLDGLILEAFAARPRRTS